MPPRVAVIIPLFNKAGTIGRAVQSVTRQTLRDIEIIVVDDGSTDDSVSRIPVGADSRLQLIRQANAGPGSARNEGARRARAPRLAFLDADDEWAPEYLSAAITALDTHPDAALYLSNFVEGPSRRLPEPPPEHRGLCPGLQEGRASSDPELLKAAVDAFDSCAAVVNRKVFEEHGGFFDREFCLYGEDSYLWLQIFLTRPFFFDPEPRVWKHTENSSLGASRLGRHPKRPALSYPEPLRAACKTGTQRHRLETLLAYYRLQETEKNRALRRDTIPTLRRSFPWPDGIPRPLRRRETKVSLRALGEKFGIARSYVPPTTGMPGNSA